MDAAPAGPPAQRHDDLGQPFLGVPGRVRGGIGKYILAQHRMVGEHPFAGRDVPIGVAVVQQPWRERRRRKARQPRKQGKTQCRRESGRQGRRKGGGNAARHGLAFGVALTL